MIAKRVSSKLSGLPTAVAAIIVVIISALSIAALIGWIINIQNLWQWWPSTGVIGDVPLQWVLSLVGLFIPLLGAITGWVF